MFGRTFRSEDLTLKVSDILLYCTFMAYPLDHTVSHLSPIFLVLTHTQVGRMQNPERKVSGPYSRLPG